MHRSLLCWLALALLFVVLACDSEVEGDADGECSDGVDNDQDGKADCGDDGCATATNCAGETALGDPQRQDSLRQAGQLLNLARAEIRAGDWKPALARLEHCLAIVPGHEECRWEQGWAFWKASDWPSVVSSWEALQSTNPDYPELAQWLAKAQKKAAGWAGSYSAFESAPGLTEDHPSPFWGYDLTINPDQETGSYAVDGFQTMVRADIRVRSTKGRAEIIFVRNAEDGGMGGNFNAGDVMFELIRHDGGIRTILRAETTNTGSDLQFTKQE